MGKGHEPPSIWRKFTPMIKGPTSKGRERGEKEGRTLLTFLPPPRDY